MLLPEPLVILASASRAYGEVDLVFADTKLGSKVKREIEMLVVEWYNRMLARPVVQALGWVPKSVTWDDWKDEFADGWGEGRLETIEGTDFAGVLTTGGDMRLLLHFLVDVDLILPLSQVWVGVEASYEWFQEWVDEEGGQFGHYTSPVLIELNRIPTAKERNRINQAVKDNIGVNPFDESEEAYWESEARLSFRVFDYPAHQEYDNLLELSQKLGKIVPVKAIGFPILIFL